MLIGPNGTGKSNLIDVLRFVDSFAWKGNELGQEVDARGGWSELTWGGRRDSELEVGVGFEHEAAYSVTIRTLVDGGIGADAEGATALGPLRGDEDIRELVEELGAGEAWYAGYEGQSDKDTLPILIRKIGYQGAVRCRVVDRGSMFSAERMEPYVRSLLKQHSHLKRILVRIDGEEFTPDQLRQRVVQPQRRRDRVATVAVRYAIVDRALEGWLACDERAVRRCSARGRG